jgi:hypothetical protein
LCLVLLGTMVSGCAGSPARRLDDEASGLGFSRHVLEGKGFEHVVYLNRESRDYPVLHVYLEGDGLPWIQQKWVASDPTPRHPVMLDLMSLDPFMSVYLGRPCYNGFAEKPPCNPGLWTHGRYSRAVIDSMADALVEVLRMTGLRRTMFFGYSGGGAIAMLLAERFPQTTAVVTIAGNLDTEQWAHHHHYSPLRTSLNPARRLPLPRGVHQLHLVGGSDRVVPPSIVTSMVGDQEGMEVRVIDGYDHRCCWRRIWPQIIAEITAREGASRTHEVSARGLAHEVR